MTETTARSAETLVRRTAFPAPKCAAGIWLGAFTVLSARLASFVLQSVDACRMTKQVQVRRYIVCRSEAN